MNGTEGHATSNPIDSVALRDAIEDSLPRGMVDWGRSVTAYIGEHPELCLGIALAIGAVVGVLVKRK